MFFWSIRSRFHLQVPLSVAQPEEMKRVSFPPFALLAKCCSWQFGLVLLVTSNEKNTGFRGRLPGLKDPFQAPGPIQWLRRPSQGLRRTLWKYGGLTQSLFIFWEGPTQQGGPSMAYLIPVGGVLAAQRQSSDLSALRMASIVCRFQSDTFWYIYGQRIQKTGKKTMETPVEVYEAYHGYFGMPVWDQDILLLWTV